MRRPPDICHKRLWNSCILNLFQGNAQDLTAAWKPGAATAPRPAGEILYDPRSKSWLFSFMSSKSIWPSTWLRVKRLDTQRWIKPPWPLPFCISQPAKGKETGHMSPKGWKYEVQDPRKNNTGTYLDLGAGESHAIYAKASYAKAISNENGKEKRNPSKGYNISRGLEVGKGLTHLRTWKKMNAPEPDELVVTEAGPWWSEKCFIIGQNIGFGFHSKKKKKLKPLKDFKQVWPNFFFFLTHQLCREGLGGKQE